MFNKLNITNLFWNIILTISASYLAIFVPLHLVFNFTIYSEYNIINNVIIIVFILDLLNNLFQYKKGISLYRFEDTIGLNNYLKTWFIIDLLAAIPYEWLSLPEIFVLIRLLKLIKIQFIFIQLKQLKIRYATFLSLSFFVFWFSHASHWISCGWLAIRGVNLEHGTMTNYISSLYWCITTLTTVGYGDITPSSNIQKLYTIFVEVLGVGVYGYLIGNVASILSKKDPAKVLYEENLEKLTALNKYRKLPHELQSRVRDYYTYMFKQRMGFNESDFLRGLPSGLKSDVSMYLKKEVIEKINLFKDADQKFIREIAQHLRPVVLTPGDCVFSEGDEGNDMFFVINGELSVYVSGNKEKIATLENGDYFGEIALFSNVKRTATVIANTYSDLYTLNKTAFNSIVINHKEIVTKIEAKVNKIENKENFSN